MELIYIISSIISIGLALMVFAYIYNKGLQKKNEDPVPIEDKYLEILSHFISTQPKIYKGKRKYIIIQEQDNNALNLEFFQRLFHSKGQCTQLDLDGTIIFSIPQGETDKGFGIIINDNNNQDGIIKALESIQRDLCHIQIRKKIDNGLQFEEILDIIKKFDQDQQDVQEDSLVFITMINYPTEKKGENHVEYTKDDKGGYYTDLPVTKGGQQSKLQETLNKQHNDLIHKDFYDSGKIQNSSQRYIENNQKNVGVASQKLDRLSFNQGTQLTNKIENQNDLFNRVLSQNPQSENPNNRVPQQYETIERMFQPPGNQNQYPSQTAGLYGKYPPQNQQNTSISQVKGPEFKQSLEQSLYVSGQNSQKEQNNMQQQFTMQSSINSQQNPNQSNQSPQYHQPQYNQIPYTQQYQGIQLINQAQTQQPYTSQSYIPQSYIPQPDIRNQNIPSGPDLNKKNLLRPSVNVEQKDLDLINFS